MKCVFKNIYNNIKLLEENILLIEKEKKTSFKHVFLLTKPNMFFLFLRTKTVFQNSVPKHNFFPKNTKNCS